MKQEKIITVAILGAGSRGLDSYAKEIALDSRYKIVCICDIRQTRLDLAKKLHNLDEKNCFLDEKEFFLSKRADLLIIATQDQDHVRQCIKAVSLGYDVILEKPITPFKKDCFRLLKAQKKFNKKVIVCHVLRYAPVYKKVSEIIFSGTIGKLIDIDAIEGVGYWHMAHSFVRGNWRNSFSTSPMILAKCCHDMDLLQYFANSKAKYVSSMGSLDFFTSKNKPEGAADRCQNCKYDKTCPYSAYNIYIKSWKESGCPDSRWPQNVVCTDLPLSEEKITKAYENNNYGRCVFSCDNNVVDHQQSNILFENGITANLCMAPFTGQGGRIYRFHGTYGELVMNETKQIIEIKVFNKPVETIPFDIINDVNGGHGGGDKNLISSIYDILNNDNIDAQTTLEASIESHLMCFAAEKSRLNNGKRIKVH